MNCHTAENLLHAERDGALSKEQHADLERHVQGCARCAQLRLEIAAAGKAVQDDAARFTVPDADEEWRLLQLERRRREHEVRTRTSTPSLLRWVGAPMAAAAALALAFQAGRMMPMLPSAQDFEVPKEARADYVEVANRDASPIVFLDQESGWLVVWAADSAQEPRGNAAI
jgi:anti-sigma factor RsiW